MDLSTEPELCPEPTAVDEIIEDVYQESPSLMPVVLDEIDDACWRESLSKTPVDEQTAETDDLPEERAEESATSMPLPDDGLATADSGQLQNEPGPDETLAADTHTPSTLSPSAALKTPTRSETVKPSSLKTTQKPQSAEDDHSLAALERQASLLYNNNPDAYWAPRPRRRPSALDYLVESPAGTHSSAGATFGSYQISPPSNVSAPPALNGHSHGDAVQERTDAMKRVGYYSLPAEVPPMPDYQHSTAFGHVVRSPPMAPARIDAALSQVGPSMLQPGYGAEKPPMSGYQLLAAKLVGGLGGRPVTPMYRRFEALNHRLLLYMQADLVELEKELQVLDSRDTMERGYGILPASRRQERWSHSQLAQQRTEVLGQIGYKLSQYNKVMASARKTQDMAIPSLHEIVEYKTYLAANRLLADEETSFLDAPDDLVCLVKEPPTTALIKPQEPTPNHQEHSPAPMPAMPAPSTTTPRAAPTSASASVATSRREEEADALEASLSQLALAVFVAVLLPVLTFAIIPGFAGRITVVALVGASIGLSLVQSGLADLLDRGALDWVLCAGAYGAVMAVVAGAVA
ncbi:hypothetical protein CDD80_5371 [Ophiocordyceps camponoti-rufipedis]|uniref:DUF6594 domain-containing protein n=1 Tax=Ophiocordyceps camponoti-rufipedis TaxID=2004952 RepID=A0A2C5YU62_9HYPO|nr:hypothetical protein CDD80_5371 [Ophiocordyceps camponoti-rufipedis]